MQKLPTIHSLMADLETAKAQAMANGQIYSVISAIALQAKITHDGDLLHTGTWNNFVYLEWIKKRGWLKSLGDWCK